MTLKYIYTLGEERVMGFRAAYSYCHAPIDNVVIEGLKCHGFPSMTCAWSQMDYSDYLERQKWIRDKFKSCPLDIEFRLWLNKPIEEDCAKC